MQCPWCKETSQNGDIRCRHCGSMLSQEQNFQQPLQPPYLEPTRVATGNNMINWYLEVLKKYASFAGRAGRKEYWYFCLCSVIVIFGLKLIGRLMDVGNLLYNIYSLATFLPGIAVGIRRMHDTNRSGWWVLVPIANIVYLAQKGQQGMNQYGSNPEAA